MIVVADTDWLQDQFSIRRMNFLGMSALQPLNDNLSFGNNSLDFLAGSSDLISIRSKGNAMRPFKVVEEIELAAREKYQEAEEKLEEDLNEVQSKLNELQSQQTQSGSLTLSPEMVKAIEEFRVREAEIRSERREIRKARREDIEALETKLLLSNLFGVPAIVFILGIMVFIKRSGRK